MITPLDIQNKEFKKSIKGYNESQVDEFLDDLMRDYEKMYKENMELRDKILMLNEQISKYNNLENTLKETLIVAQSTADDVVASAKDKGNIIIENAKLESQKLLDNANEDLKKVREKYEYLLKEMIIFKTRYRSFMEAQLDTLNEFYTEVEKKVDKNDNEMDKEYIDDFQEENLDFSDIETENNIDELGA